MFTFTPGQQATLRRLGKSGAEPIYMVELQLLARTFLQVTDYLAPAIGEQIEIGADGTPAWATLTLSASQVGTNFARGASNAEQARNIAMAARTGGLRAVAENNFVHFLARSTIDRLFVNSVDDPSWVPNPSVEWREVRGTRRFVSGSTHRFGYDPILTSVPPGIGVMEDPRTKKQSSSEFSIGFVDEGTIRSLIRRFILTKGKVVRIFKGDEESTEVDMVPMGAFYLVDHDTDGSSADPDSRHPSKEIQLKLRDFVLYQLSQAQAIPTSLFPGDIINRHPLEALEFCLEWARVDPALYDATTLDPSDAAHDDWSHHNVGRLNWKDQQVTGIIFQSTDVEIEATGRIAEATKLIELVDELRPGLRGIFAAEEDGVCRFRRSNPLTDAVARVWDRSVFEPDPPSGYAENLINYLTVNYLSGIGSTAHSKKYVRGDLDSQILLAPDWDGAGTFPNGRFDGSLQMKGWFNGAGFFDRIIGINSGILISTQGAGTTFSVCFSGILPFCGGRFDGILPGGGPQTIPAWAELDPGGADRVAYLMLEAEAGGSALVSGQQPAWREIIAIDAINVRASEAQDPTFQHITYQAEGNQGLIYPMLTFRILARAQYGTTSPDSWGLGTKVSDVTMQVLAAEEQVRRQRFGMPIISGRTRSDQWDMQLRDLVQIPHSSFVQHRDDGGNFAIWEIVGKRDEKTRIHWTLAFARASNDATESVPAIPDSPPVDIPSSTPRDYYYDASGADYVAPDGTRYWKVY